MPEEQAKQSKAQASRAHSSLRGPGSRNEEDLQKTERSTKKHTAERKGLPTLKCEDQGQKSTEAN